MNPAGQSNAGHGPFQQQIPQSLMTMPPGHTMPQGQGQFVNYSQGQFPGHGMMMRQPMFNTNMMGMRPPGAPPSYNQALNQSSLPRQRMQGSQMQRPQRKTEEEIQKEKYFQQQQAKLKQFKTSGAPSLDPNKLVDSIFGATAAAKPKIIKPASAPALADPDDGFGDFLGSPPDPFPSGSLPSQTVSNQIIGTSPQMSTNDQTAILNIGTSQQTTVRTMGTSPQNVGSSPQNVVTSPQNTTASSSSSPTTASVQQKDLKRMMLDSCDLMAPQKARLFQKPALKEINPVHVQVTAHHTSQNARRWDRSEELSELFIQEAVKDESTMPKPKPKATVTRRRRPSAPPAWLTDDALLPPVYRQILEASLLNGQINIERLYPILMMSGLPREVMGQLWALCNTAKPGELTVKELYELLAVIALVQNNYKVESLDILSQCPQAPVPFFAAAGNQAPPQQGPRPTGSGPVLTQSAQMFVASNQSVVGNQSTVQSPVSTVAPISAKNQFLGNQSGSVAQMQTAYQSADQSGLGSMPGHVTGISVTSSMTSLPATLPVTQLPSAGISSGQRRNVVEVAQISANDDDDFADFQGATMSPPKPDPVLVPPVKQLPAPVKDASKFLYQPPTSESKPIKGFSSPDLGVSTVQNFFGSDDSSETTSPDDDYLDGYKSADSKPSDSTSQFSTDQSEGEDFKNFENYLDEFQRKKDMQDKESPLHRPVSKFLGKENVPKSSSKVLHKPAKAVQKLFPLPNVKQPSSDEFSDFADFQSAPVLADVTQSNRDDPLKASASAVDLIGDEDKYAALRSLEVAAENDEEHVAAVLGPNLESKLPNDTDDDNWADFQAVSKESEITGAQEAVSNLPNVLVLSKTDESTTSEKAGIDGSLGVAPKSYDGILSHSVFSPVEDKVSAKKDVDDAMGWADFQSSYDEFTEFQSSEQQGTGEKDEKKTELINVKRDKLDASEILGLFKVKTEPFVNIKGRDDDSAFPAKAEISMSSVVNTMHGIVVSENIAKETETKKQKHFSEEDDYMKPPPLDDFHDVDHDDMARGYDFGDFMETKAPEKKAVFGVYGLNENFVVEGHKKETANVSKVTIELTKDSDNDADSVSLKDVDGDMFKGKLGFNKSEDSQSVASLDLVVHKSLQNLRDNGEGDTQSVSSNELSNFEVGVNINKDILAESKSLDSLDLRKEETIGNESGQESSDRETKDNSPSLEHQDYKKPEFDLDSSLTTLPIITDRYSAISHNIPGSDKHSYEWQRCLENCCKIIQDANNTFNSISSSNVCSEVIKSSQGSQYIQGVIEIYRVVCKITVTMQKAGVCNDHLSQLLKDIDLAWNNLTAFLVGGSVMPDEKSLDFHHGALLCDDTTSQYKACGVCLLDVEMRIKGLNLDNDNAKLTYAGRQYHAPCANFWINCVDSTLPALKLLELI